jgi:hypothetical protein
MTFRGGFFNYWYATLSGKYNNRTYDHPMKLKFLLPNAHPSAKLGVLSLLLGIVGSGIGYLGLYLKQDMMGLIAVIIIGFAALGALAALIWNFIWTMRGGERRP